MARLLENISKKLLKKNEIPVPDNLTAKNKSDVQKAFYKLDGPIVIKGLVPVGKRQKAGAVKFASTVEEAEEESEKILSMKIGFYKVKKVLVEEKLDISKEYYLCITLDQSLKTPVIIASTEGGVDIEEISRVKPDVIKKYWVNPLKGLELYQAREIWSDLGVTGKCLNKIGVITYKLYQFFIKYDSYILEINPLAITKDDDEVVVVASLMGVDDSAIQRQSELYKEIKMGTERVWRKLTNLEKKAIEINEKEPYRGTARYTEMDSGNIGFMCGGGGASLLLFDALVELGLQPANYSEFGGNPTEDKVYGLAKVILSKPGVKGLFIAQNITNNTQVDVVARGVLKAIDEMEINPAIFPIVVREAGVNDKIARDLFSRAGIEYYGDDITLTQAAIRMAEKMKEYSNVK
jgi:succinyl-CoA synthetase beta subunit